jgi:predicted transcriptional regulator
MPPRDFAHKRNGRHSILDLAPLELECLRVLWPRGEGTVRDIRDALAASRPRAYTTIMTIMDRMAQKGIVTRRKSGRAWLYLPNISAEQARSGAVRSLIDHFFGGSPQALLAHLSGGNPAEFLPAPHSEPAVAAPRAPRAPRKVADSSAAPVSSPRMDDALL